MANFYSFKVRSLEGGEDLLAAVAGHVVLAVNVASECGLTPQYAGLEKLHRELKDGKFAVVGFPCNQFGAQEPGDAAAIRTFCSTRYGVSFPLSAKLEVNGPKRDPLYAWLTDKANGHPSRLIRNFSKFHSMSPG